MSTFTNRLRNSLFGGALAASLCSVIVLQSACGGGDSSASSGSEAPAAPVQPTYTPGQLVMEGTDAAGDIISFQGVLGDDGHSVKGEYLVTGAQGASAQFAIDDALAAPSITQLSDTEYTFEDGSGQGRLEDLQYESSSGAYSGTVVRADGTTYEVAGRLPAALASTTQDAQGVRVEVAPVVVFIVCAAIVIGIAVVACAAVTVTSMGLCAWRDRCWSYSASATAGESSWSSVCTGSCVACPTGDAGAAGAATTPGASTGSPRIDGGVGGDVPPGAG